MADRPMYFDEREKYGLISVTKIFRFCYAHKLDDYDGPCSRVHGHNAKVEISVHDHTWGSKVPGMMVDFGVIKEVVQRKVVDILDHRLINEVPEFGKNPTAENFCLWIKDRVNKEFDKIGKAEVVRIRVYETDDSYAEWRKYDSPQYL